MALKINFKKFIQVIALIGMPFFIACSHTSENIKTVQAMEFRGIPMTSEPVAFKVERTIASYSNDSIMEVAQVAQRLGEFKNDLSDVNVFNRKTCENFLMDRNENIFPRSSTDLIRSLANSAEDRAEQVEAMKNDVLRIRTTISVFMDSNTLIEKSCVEQLKESVRRVRHLEDYLREVQIKSSAYKIARDSLLQRNQLELNSFQNPIQYEFAAGDFILLKDFEIKNTFMAKLNDPKSDFNRIALVVQNSKKKLFVLEASPSVGAVLIPVAQFNSQNLARAYVARANSADLAESLAKFVFAKVTDRFGRLDSKYKALSFDVGQESKRLLVFDLIKQGLESANAPVGLLNSLNELSDFEVNPYVFPVFEARNLDALKSLRIESAAVQSILDWQQTKTYQFAASRSSDLNSEAKSYSQVLSTLMHELQLRDSMRSIESGAPLFDLDLVNLVNQFRVADCRVFKSSAGKTSQFHHVFSPRSQNCD